MINLDECSDTETQWVALYVQNNDVTYFDSFEAEHIPKGIKTFINNKNIKTNIFRIQAYDSVMCELNWIYKFFSPNNFKRNDDIILKYSITNFKNDWMLLLWNS